MISNTGGLSPIQPDYSIGVSKSSPTEVGTANLRKAAMGTFEKMSSKEEKEFTDPVTSGSETKKGKDLLSKAGRKSVAFATLVYTNIESTNASIHHFAAVGAGTVANLQSAFKDEKI